MGSHYCKLYQSKHIYCEDCESFLNCLKHLVIIKTFTVIKRSRKYSSEIQQLDLVTQILASPKEKILALEQYIDEAL